MQLPRIAIIYDRLNKFGGAENVLIALQEAFPQAVFFTSVHDTSKTPWARGWDIRTSFLQYIPFARNHHDKLAIFMPAAFASFDLSDYDIIISVTSEFAKGVRTSANQMHICYCLTPTRYLWSHTYFYEGKRFGWLKQFVFSLLREKDFMLAKLPTTYIAISKRVKARIEKYYRREVDTIIYPPFLLEGKDISQFESHHPDKLNNEYFLIVSRLVPYKRVDLAIQACLRAQKRLIVVGTGSEEKRLRALAKKSNLIEFTGFVSNTQLSSLYQGAKALLCPQEEDFGIISLEAQAHGIPILTYAQSGVAETICKGKTGVLVTDQTVDSFVQGIATLEKTEWNPRVIRDHGQRFSKQTFIASWKAYIQKVYCEGKEKTRIL